jgi:hypothetical protein
VRRERPMSSRTQQEPAICPQGGRSPLRSDDGFLTDVC